MRMRTGLVLAVAAAICQLSGAFRLSRLVGSHSLHSFTMSTGLKEGTSSSVDVGVSPKSVTKEIMAFFTQRTAPATAEQDFKKRLQDPEVNNNLDGIHMLVIMFQCARTRRQARNILPLQTYIEKIEKWNRPWSERDISTFVYGIRSLRGLDPAEGTLLKLAAKKISESPAEMGSRSIGNSLYGLQDLTSGNVGAPEVCSALAEKIENFEGDLTGQDIGIGLYGLQGMAAEVPEVRRLIVALEKAISKSETDFDAQALSNALYGLQSMSSDYPEVLKLVGALSVKVAESTPDLIPQAIGSAIFGLQKMSSDKLEVRTMIVALAEKMESFTAELDAQALANSLYGMQRMKSNSAEVRALVQAITNRLTSQKLQMDPKAIGNGIYGLQSLSSDVPQVRALLGALAESIRESDCQLGGQGIADALFGLSNMRTDCVELRALLSALADKIDSDSGKLDAQEISNALYGLQAYNSDVSELGQIAVKLGDKLKRSRAVLLSQHIGRSLLGFQSVTAESKEIRYLLRQLIQRIRESDRTRMTAQGISDALNGLQGMNSAVPEVQELVGELAKKIAATAATFNSEQMGNALFGLQGLSSRSSFIQESAIGLDIDEVNFLVSAMWDKVKIMREPMSLRAASKGLLGVYNLRDPIGENIRQYMYSTIIKMSDKTFLARAEGVLVVDDDADAVDQTMVSTDGKKRKAYVPKGREMPVQATEESGKEDSPAAPKVKLDPIDIIQAYRALVLSDLLIPGWLEKEYKQLTEEHAKQPVIPVNNRQEKLITQKYTQVHPNEDIVTNALIDGFRLDMHFPSLMLNIELDGPSHRFPARKRYDTVRDRYFTEVLGYSVHRVKMADLSVEDAVAKIYEIVSKRSENFADAEVQKLYLREEKLQELYKSGKQLDE